MYNADTTPKAPRQCKYIESTIDNERQNRSKPMRAVYNTPHETFPLLCFWQSVWSCEVLMASKPKRTVTPYTVCMSAQPLPIGASGMGIDVTKITLLSWKPLFLAGKIWFLRFDLTLLNINMSKNSTFAWFFLPKSLYYQWLFVFLQR